MSTPILKISVIEVTKSSTTYVLDTRGDVISSRLDRDVLVAIKVDAGRSSGPEELPLHPLVARQRDRPVLLRRASRWGPSLKPVANRTAVWRRK